MVSVSEGESAKKAPLQSRGDDIPFHTQLRLLLLSVDDRHRTRLFRSLSYYDDAARRDGDMGYPISDWTFRAVGHGLQVAELALDSVLQSLGILGGSDEDRLQHARSVGGGFGEEDQRYKELLAKESSYTSSCPRGSLLEPTNQLCPGRVGSSVRGGIHRGHDG